VLEKTFRLNLIEKHLQELIAEGTVLVDVDGAVVGQVNGLAVYQMGDFTFGKPSRITAKTFMGRGGIINIERESKLSGKTHDKGVLILGGYLGGKYAQESPLSLSSTVCFEQSYDGVDGDSASSTELYAILSSLSEIPIRQGIAVTGSVNQNGEIQAIGGVNQKIEGHYDVCRLKGLTGAQGVMIPRANLRNLMLRSDVVEAVKTGKFRVYAVGTIDEGIEVLTGVPAGQRDREGRYPEGSVNDRVEQRLRQFTEQQKKLAAAVNQQYFGAPVD
jgi:predicted ATP-dependent protease